MNNIKKLRLQKGITRKELASKVKISETYLYYLETGKRKKPSAQVAIKIADVLEIRVQNLLEL